MAGDENETCIQNLNTKIYTINAQDSRRDNDTNNYNLSISNIMPLCNNGNLPPKLNICIGAKIMLTDNINMSDRLINGSTGTAERIHMANQSKLLNGIIYVLFDDPFVGESLKNRRKIKN